MWGEVGWESGTVDGGQECPVSWYGRNNLTICNETSCGLPPDRSSTLCDGHQSLPLSVRACSVIRVSGCRAWRDVHAHAAEINFMQWSISRCLSRVLVTNLYIVTGPPPAEVRHKTVSAQVDDSMSRPQGLVGWHRRWYRVNVSETRLTAKRQS